MGAEAVLSLLELIHCNLSTIIDFRLAVLFLRERGAS